MILFLAFSFVYATSVGAEDVIDVSDWEEEDWEEYKGGEVVLTTGTVNHMLPAYHTDAGDYDVGNMMFESPKVWEGTADFFNTLAEDTFFNEDNTVFTIKLRDDIEWGDGTPITADDLLYTYRDVTENPDAGAGLYGDFENVEEFNVVDDRTIEFHLTHSDPSFYYQITRNMVLAEHIFGDIPVEELAGHEYQLDPPEAAQIGPFELESYVPDEEVILERNENWNSRIERGEEVPRFFSEWPEEALLDRIIYLNIPDYETEKMMFEAGDIDHFSPADRDVEEFVEAAEDGEYQMTNYPSRGYSVVQWNLQAEPLNERKVRQALRKAIDFETLIEVEHEGRAEKAYFPWAPQMWAYTDEMIESVRTYNYDPERAEELLAEAGYEDGIELSMQFQQTDEPTLQIMLQDMWREIGVDVELVMQEWGSLLDDLGTGDYELAQFGYGTGSHPTVTQFTLEDEEEYEEIVEQGGDWTTYYNPELHEMQRKADATICEEETMDIYKEAMDIWMRDLPILTLTHGENYHFWSNDLQGFKPTEIGYYYNASEWHISD